MFGTLEGDDDSDEAMSLPRLNRPAISSPISFGIPFSAGISQKQQLVCACLRSAPSYLYLLQVVHLVLRLIGRHHRDRQMNIPGLRVHGFGLLCIFPFEVVQGRRAHSGGLLHLIDCENRRMLRLELR